MSRLADHWDPRITLDLLEENARRRPHSHGLLRIAAGVYATDQLPHDANTLVVEKHEREAWKAGPPQIGSLQTYWWTWRIGKGKQRGRTDGGAYFTKMDALGAAVEFCEEAMRLIGLEASG